MNLPVRPVEVVPEIGLKISTSLTDPETKRLKELAADKRVLEVGSAYGYSTIHMAEVAKFVVSVDPHVDLADTRLGMLENLRRTAMTQKVSMVVQYSQHALPMLHYSGCQFDFLFVDGDHRKEMVATDFCWGEMCVRLGGMIAFHDYGEDSSPGVKQALDALRPQGYELIDTLWVIQR